MNFIYRMLFHVSVLKTLYINFRCLPMKMAVKLPILVGNRVSLKGMRKGAIKLNGMVRPFCIRLGLENDFSIYPNKREYSMLRCEKNSCIHICPGPRGGKILNGFSITNRGNIYIGKNFVMNQHCTIYCRKEIRFGDYNRVGWNCQFLDTDLHCVYNINTNRISNPIGKVNLGNNVWIASGCSIMKNSEIPDFSIVASGSLVNKSFANVESVGNFFAGSPAKLKATGVVRILKEDFQNKVMRQFSKTGAEFMEMDADFDFKNYCKD